MRELRINWNEWPKFSKKIHRRRGVLCTMNVCLNYGRPIAKDCLSHSQLPCGQQVNRRRIVQVDFFEQVLSTTKPVMMWSTSGKRYQNKKATSEQATARALLIEEIHACVCVQH